MYQCKMAGRVYQSASASCKAAAKEAAALIALQALGWQQPEDKPEAGSSAAPISYVSRLTEYSQSETGFMPKYTCGSCLPAGNLVPSAPTAA